jgi:hypothetical protein
MTTNTELLHAALYRQEQIMETLAFVLNEMEERQAQLEMDAVQRDDAVMVKRHRVDMDILAAKRDSCRALVDEWRRDRERKVGV